MHHDSVQMAQLLVHSKPGVTWKAYLVLSDIPGARLQKMGEDVIEIISIKFHLYDFILLTNLITKCIYFSMHKHTHTYICIYNDSPS